MINFVNSRINQKLSLGYDVGKGFVIGEEEVSKLIDRLVDNESILGYLKNTSETTRLGCIRELGKWRLYFYNYYHKPEGSLWNNTQSFLIINKVRIELNLTQVRCSMYILIQR